MKSLHGVVIATVFCICLAAVSFFFIAHAKAIPPVIAPASETVISHATSTSVVASTSVVTISHASSTATAAVQVVPKDEQVFGVPIRITIDKIHVDAQVQDLGLTASGAMDAPTNITDVGWLTMTAHPGAPGVAVIDGHVAQIRGGVMTKPGVFYDVTQLAAGDSIIATDYLGQQTTFVVREVRRIDPNADASDIFTSSDGKAHLNLITCDGIWNAADHSYSQRLVVFADAI